MSLSLAGAAEYVAQLYAYPNFAAFPGLTTEIEGVYLGVVRRDDVTCVIFRGSTTRGDWERDLISQNGVEDSDLGLVPLGFNQGMAEVHRYLLAAVPADRPVVFLGHSLGAARAANECGRWVVAGRAALGLVRWGSPRPGAARLSKILRPVPQWTFRNESDPVCDVPFDIPLLAPFEHTGPMRELHEAPLSTDVWGPFAAHHFQLYLAGTARLDMPPVVP